ncbi:MAG: phosphate acetyltransferase [Planctomycetota bacterium]
MSETIFIAASEPASGKTMLSIGLVASLKTMVNAVGYVKVIGLRRGEGGVAGDKDVQVIRGILQNTDDPGDMCPTMLQDVRGSILEGKKDDVIRKIVKSFKSVAVGKDVVVVEGTDHMEMLANMELNINADVAKAVRAKVLLVVKGGTRSGEDILSEIETACASYVEKGCQILGAVINDVPADACDKVGRSLRGRLAKCDLALLGVIPRSDILPHPRMKDLVTLLKAEVIHGKEGLDALGRGYIVGAMQAANALKYFKDDGVIITAGDRDDLILAVVAAQLAPGFPRTAGIILTGGIKPAAVIRKLVEGVGGFTVPILAVDMDTYSAVDTIENMVVNIEPGDQQKIEEAAGLVQKALDVKEIFAQSRITIIKRRTPEEFLENLEIQAAKADKHIVFPEGGEPRIIRAAAEIAARKMARITIMGNPEEVQLKARQLNVDLGKVAIVDPMQNTKRSREFVEILFEKRKHKGLSMTMAEDLVRDAIYFGTMMVETGEADGLVSGSTHSTANTIRPALQIIKTAPGVNTVSSVFFMLKESKVFLYADCAIVEDPTAAQLGDIAISSILTARTFDMTPYVAMLSFSTGDSGKGPMVEKVKEAVRLAKAGATDAVIEGPMQYDAAFAPEVAKVKYPQSKVAGKANVFIFPDLNSGNIAYKAVQREAGAIALGPILQGLRKPVNDLSRGCTVEDIIYVTAITAIQASFLGR